MAVFERNYKRWTGELTPRSTRFLILPRYLFRDVFASKLLLFFYAGCFLFPIGCLGLIYITHSAKFLELFKAQIFVLDGDFLSIFLHVQCALAFLLALFIGPGLVSRDLANNGLPLYLSRPFSRTEYVLGKFTVLATLLSTVTWMAGGLVIAAQVGFEGMSWLSSNFSLVMAVFTVSWLWIVVLCMLAISVSAWVRWKPIAGFAMVFVLLAGFFLGQMINALFDTEMGNLIDIYHLRWVLQANWLGIEPPSGISPLLATCALCCFAAFFLFLLNRKIRAYEVVS